jgi:alkanesulfonate monooxygenase SsuD/methylene tetrahydromethanopterin reductase-like flavin-dependent oxidoreductase (luciferase family)
MRFGIFYEHQLPRPWSGDAEHRLLKDALEQVELADRLGIDYVWEVEHHFLEEYSHSPAPEVFLAAASQRTSRIRLGHGIVQLPPGVNHPARVAERIATLDLLSDGRVEFGTGESSSGTELGGFLVERTRKRAQWADAVDAITRMFVEEPFAGWESEFVRMPPRNVVPKPLQKPHPPLWVACSRRETIRLAAEHGIGALSFSFVEPEEAAGWVRDYEQIVASDSCVPAGFAVNANVAVVLPMMLHSDEATAIERGIDGAHFFGYSLAHYYGAGRHMPSLTDVHGEFRAHRDERGFARRIVTPDQAPLGVRILQQGMGSLRGAIGTPDQVRDLIRRYESAGVDQVIFVMQAGTNRHEHICEALELFAAEVLPEFASAADEREAAKAQRLGPAIEAALARKPAPRQAPPGYQVDEEAEMSRARRAARRLPAPREAAKFVRGVVRERVQTGALSGLTRLVRGRSDSELERRFGSERVQRAMLTAMTKNFRASRSGGFEGDIVYELAVNGDAPDGSDSSGRFSRWAGPSDSRAWTVRVESRRARLLAGRQAADPALTLRLPVAAFARLAAREAKPLPLILSGSLQLEGDLALAARLEEMFGGSSPY